MKFSPRKKAKIRKMNQKKIKRYCKNMIGHHIYDGDHCYEVMDQAKINDVIYLLVQVEENEYAIYKIVKVFEYVRLSNKKILEKQKKFSNHVYWEEHSTIQINADGKIESVKFGTIFGPYNCRKSNKYVQIIIDVIE